jgi:hypothetical protein
MLTPSSITGVVVAKLALFSLKAATYIHNEIIPNTLFFNHLNGYQIGCSRRDYSVIVVINKNLSFVAATLALTFRQGQALQLQFYVKF